MLCNGGWRLSKGLQMYVGSVKAVKLDGGYFFVKLPGSPDVWCHSMDLKGDIDFDETLLERRVEFELTHSHKGPRGLNVRPAKD